MRSNLRLAFPVAVVAVFTTAIAAPLGLFQGPTDVGLVSRPTIASHDETAGTYTISASGDNMWGPRDAFGFVWTHVSADADLALAADITFVGTSTQGHRKACLMFRQSLAPDSAYVDVAVHGDGLTSLQFRRDAGGPTREVQCSVSAPRRVRLEKRGDYVLLHVAGDDGVLAPTGCTVRLPFTDSFYAGLAVCAHDNAAVETAVFSRVELGAPVPRATNTARTFAIETIPLASLDRRVVHHASDRLESPHYSPDGATLYFNSNGRIHRLPADGSGTPVVVDTGFATRCNNDHGISPDGTLMVIGDLSETGKALMYLLPVAGGPPRRIEVAPPAYWHGWSPDGLTLAYTAERGGNYDVYTVPVEGGSETRLTDHPGTDNGSDYSADGQWIYFHTPRTGRVQIWRMRPDGSGQEAVTSDDFENWFPHPSPDGQWIAVLSSKVAPDTGHPPDGDYVLRLLPVAGGAPREIAHFYAGNGSFNVPSWAPDSSRLAYVSQEPK